MAIPELPPDFSDFLQLLNSKGVRYLLLGGYAVIYHGYVRSTGDMDLWVAISPDNAARAVQALREFGFDLPELTGELFLRPRTVVRQETPANPGTPVRHGRPAGCPCQSWRRLPARAPAAVRRRGEGAGIALEPPRSGQLPGVFVAHAGHFSLRRSDAAAPAGRP